MSNEPTKPAPATDELREKAREWLTGQEMQFVGGQWQYHDGCTPSESGLPMILALFASQVLQQAFCEAHAPEDCKTCPCCEAVHQNDLLKQAEQRIAELRHDHHLQWQVEVDLRKAAERERDEARAQIKSASEPPQEGDR